MNLKKVFPVVLIFIGIAFVLGALFSWFDNLTAAEPVGLGKWIFDVLQFISGIGGTWFGIWLSTKKSKSENAGNAQRIQEAINSPDSEQTMEGKVGAQKQKTVDSPRSKQTMK